MQQGESSSLAFRLVIVTGPDDVTAPRRLQGWTKGKLTHVQCLSALVPLATSVLLQRDSTSGSGR